MSLPGKRAGRVCFALWLTLLSLFAASDASSAERLRIAVLRLGLQAAPAPAVSAYTPPTTVRTFPSRGDADPGAAAIEALDADIIAVFQAPTALAVRRLFPAGTYHMIYARQALGPAAELAGLARERLTAWVVRRESGVRLQRVEHLNAIDDAAATLDTGASAALSAQAVVGGKGLWLLAIDAYGECGETRRTCAPLPGRQALMTLWVAARQSERAAYVVAVRFPETNDEPHPPWKSLRVAKSGTTGDANVSATWRPPAASGSSIEPADREPPSLVGVGKMQHRASPVVPVPRGPRVEDVPEGPAESPEGSPVTLVLDAFKAFADAQKEARKRRDASADRASTPDPAPTIEQAPAELPPPGVAVGPELARFPDALSPACGDGSVSAANEALLFDRRLPERNLLIDARVQVLDAAAREAGAPACIPFVDIRRQE